MQRTAYMNGYMQFTINTTIIITTVHLNASTIDIHSSIVISRTPNEATQT